MKESTPTENAFVRGPSLDTSMMYMGSIMSFLIRAQDTVYCNKSTLFNQG